MHQGRLQIRSSLVAAASLDSSAPLAIVDTAFSHDAPAAFLNQRRA
jgi:hypothetical protein